MFAAPQARKFSKEFTAAFGKYGGFHMVDLVSKRKGFKGVSDAERDRLIKDAVRIVRNRFSYGVAVTVDIAEYEAQAPAFIRGFKGAYPFLCHMAMSAVPFVMKKHDDKRSVTYIYEAGHAFMAEAQFIVAQMSTTSETRQHYFYSGHAFLPKTDAVPLQAADLLAWEAAKFKDESIDGNRDIRKSLQCLLEPDTTRYHVAFVGGASLTRALNKYRKMGIEQLQEEMECRKNKHIQKTSKYLKSQ